MSRLTTADVRKTLQSEVKIEGRNNKAKYSGMC